MEHVNICVPTHGPAKQLYYDVLGFSPDERRAHNIEKGSGTIWANLGVRQVLLHFFFAFASIIQSCLGSYHRFPDGGPGLDLQQLFFAGREHGRSEARSSFRHSSSLRQLASASVQRRRPEDRFRYPIQIIDGSMGEWQNDWRLPSCPIRLR